MTRLKGILVGLVLLVTFSIGLIFIAPAKSTVEDKGSVQERIIALGQQDNRVMEHLYYLTDRIGPRPAGSEEMEIAREWARDKFVSFGLTNAHLEECAEESIPFFVTLVQDLIKIRAPMYNVVADIPGTQIQDEYVIIGAHIDSEDAGTGATDNGTGVAAAMEAARILVESGAQPRRTIRFVLFAGEELGKVGSMAYVADHPELMPRISAMFNMDQGSNHISGVYATDAMMEDFEKVFAPVKSLNPDMPFKVEKVEHLTQIIADCCGSAGTSDHGPFYEAGVPAFNWLQKAKNPDPYRPHSEYDTYEYVTAEYQEHSATVIALAALGTANLDHMLSRENMTDPSELLAQSNPCCPSGSPLPSECRTRRSGCCRSASSIISKLKEKVGICCPSGSSTKSKSKDKGSGCCPSESKSCDHPGCKTKARTCCPSGTGTRSAI